MQTVYFSLLQKWCDALIACQAHDLGPAFTARFSVPPANFPTAAARTRSIPCYTWPGAPGKTATSRPPRRFSTGMTGT